MVSGCGITGAQPRGSAPAQGWGLFFLVSPNSKNSSQLPGIGWGARLLGHRVDVVTCQRGAGCVILPNVLPMPALPGPCSTPVPAGVGLIQPLERDGFGMTRSLPLSGQPESHRGCRVFPKLFRHLRTSPQATALPSPRGQPTGTLWGCGWIQPASTLSLASAPWAAPALRTVSSWSGVSSDSQITSWLWVVQGAPHRGTAGGCVPTPALGLQILPGCGL